MIYIFYCISRFNYYSFDFKINKVFLISSSFWSIFLCKLIISSFKLFYFLLNSLYNCAFSIVNLLSISSNFYPNYFSWFSNNFSYFSSNKFPVFNKFFIYSFLFYISYFLSSIYLSFCWILIVIWFSYYFTATFCCSVYFYFIYKQSYLSLIYSYLIEISYLRRVVY